MDPYHLMRMMNGGQLAGIPNSIHRRRGQRQRTRRPNRIHARKARVRRHA